MKIGQEGAHGLTPFSPAAGIAALEYILTNHLNQALVQTISNLDQFKLTLPLGGHFYDDVKRVESRTTSSAALADKYRDLADQIFRTSTEAERVSFVQSYVSSVLRETLSMGVDEEIDEDQDWTELGVDSLMAIEIRNRLQAQVIGEGRALTVMGMQANRTLKSAAEYVARMISSDGVPEVDPRDSSSL